MKAVLVLVLLSGCSAMFDLSAAENGDSDGDGIATSVDNCPSVYNPDQSNLDHDELGDACDACDLSDSADVDMDGIPDSCDGCVGSGVDADMNGVDDACESCQGNGTDSDGDGVDDNCDKCAGGPEHDEDRDGIPDACDVCPHIASSDQTDTDGDLVGDMCDPAATGSVMFFDPFTTQDPSWNEDGTGWVFESAFDAFAVTPTAPTLRVHGTIAVGDVQLATQASLKQLPGGGLGRVELFVAQKHDQMPSMPFLSCGVDAMGRLHASAQATSEKIATGTISRPDLPFELSMVETKGNATFTCTVRQASTTLTVSNGVPACVTWEPGIAVADATAEFSYFAVVSPKQ